MARIRTIKPEFWTDKKIIRLSRDARLFFIGLWNFADDNGVLEADPLQLKAWIFPVDPDIGIEEIEKFLAELEKLELIKIYEINGTSYIWIKNFSKHQKIDRPRKSNLPLPPEENQVLNKKETFQMISDEISRNQLKSIEIISGKEKEMEMEKEKERENEKEKEKEEKICSANALHVLTTNTVRTPSEPLQPSLKEQSLQNTSPPLKDDLPYKISACPYQEIVKLYHEILPELPTVKVLNKTRKAYLRSRWREILSKPELLSIFVPEHEDMLMASEKQKGLLWFRRYFEYVSQEKVELPLFKQILSGLLDLQILSKYLKDDTIREQVL